LISLVVNHSLKAVEVAVNLALTTHRLTRLWFLSWNTQDNLRLHKRG